MELTPEMKEMMERTMEQYFAAYWEKHATSEQEQKRVLEGKTFEGAVAFVRSVASTFRGKGAAGCVAMPDDLAYWLLMEYMASVPEGAKYKGDGKIEAPKPSEEKPAKKSAKTPAEPEARTDATKKAGMAIKKKIDDFQLMLF